MGVNTAAEKHTLAALQSIGDRLRATLAAKNEARDTALRHSRTLVRYCANTIRAIHRGEMEQAQELLVQAEETAAALRAGESIRNFDEKQSFPMFFWGAGVAFGRRLVLASSGRAGLAWPEEWWWGGLAAGLG